MNRWLSLIALLLLPLPLYAAVIEGRVVSDDRAQSGITVQAFSAFDFTAVPLATAAPTA